MMKLATWMSGCLLALGMVSGASAASNWPDRPVNLIVPYPAGAGVDPVARLIGQKLSERWGQPVIVQNKAGASGSIGAAYVARSHPDGLTIMMSATAEVVINQFIMKQMPYDPEKDLEPVTLAVRLPFVLVTGPKAPYSTIPELIDYAKQHPGTVTYASSGTGTPQHLAAVLLEQLAGIKMAHIPYKGVAPSISALLAGEVNIGFVGLPAGLPYIQSSQLKALAVSSARAAAAAPNIPPVSATPGLEKYDLTQWFGVFVPTGTPDDVVQHIQKDVHDVLQMPDIRQKLMVQGAEPSGMPTAEFRNFVQQERKKFADIVKAGNVAAADQ
jgi:tripartite-type tricarboxylate transporter receptor subunit TctC